MAICILGYEVFLSLMDSSFWEIGGSTISGSKHLNKLMVTLFNKKKCNSKNVKKSLL